MFCDESNDYLLVCLDVNMREKAFALFKNIISRELSLISNGITAKYI
jgi:hypothetical protein